MALRDAQQEIADGYRATALRIRDKTLLFINDEQRESLMWLVRRSHDATRLAASLKDVQAASETRLASMQEEIASLQSELSDCLAELENANAEVHKMAVRASEAEATILDILSVIEGATVVEDFDDENENDDEIVVHPEACGALV